MGNDIFADIASGGMGGRHELLTIPAPAVVPSAVCELSTGTFIPEKTKVRISTGLELKSELAKRKVIHAEFLKDYAPAIKSCRERIDIKEFVLNNTEKITLPHYKGPLGHAEQLYAAEFLQGVIGPEKAVYICFKGADYKASVYINKICVGFHEGFFSPFEFEITNLVKDGKNLLEIRLENDYVFMGNKNEEGGFFEGDKLYAATGLGYDDPQCGWHHCPPGMGIYNEVFIEIRNRTHLSDLFVRPLPDKSIAEIWAEIENADYETKEILFNISIYGQNFEETIVKDYEYTPHTIKMVGMGDSLTEASVKAKGELGKGMPMPLKKGRNLYKIPIRIENPKRWDLETPYLYQLQIDVIENNMIKDSRKQQFGMRDFKQDVEGTQTDDNGMKGMFFLNGRKIRLRGANTMGFEQQDVLRGNIEQLIDDILLAKICNMNFLRLTQRPVQDEVYEYCDKLGLMTQTDLPLFGCVRRTKFCEGVRQAEEMERLIRSHPCNVIVSYINEPFPNAYNQPHRHLERTELQQFFTACDMVVKLNNPDRVIKHVDGDYDPPDEKMPDNHCYPMWYNGHGIDIGRLHKGYWLAVKPDWYYGCGEFGAEGLDFSHIMREYYPASWTREPFDPHHIIGAQTGNFHYFFYDTPKTMEDWVEKSQRHQAFATKIMTEAFRRDRRMVSFAIHLFIDAWPSGWMKSIMDFKRNPKPAYFAYMEALEKVKISLRSDRFMFFDNEEIKIESWLCNDTNEGIHQNITYELYIKDRPIPVMKGTQMVSCDPMDVSCSGVIHFSPPKVSKRESFVLKAIMGEADTLFEFDVLEETAIDHNENVVFAGDDLSMLELVREGKTVVLERLEPGKYILFDDEIEVKSCGMLPLHFVSRATGHPLVEGFKEDDFRMWFDGAEGMIMPILTSTFTGGGFIPILASGNTDSSGDWTAALAVAEKQVGNGRVILCQVDLSRRLDHPIARLFHNRICSY